MKHVFFLAGCLASSLAFGQFTRVPVKSAPAQPVKPVAVQTLPIKATLITPTANFTNPSNVFTLPDGKRMTVTMRQNVPNLAQNFGGVVKEQVLNSSKFMKDGMNCTSETKMLTAESSTFMNVNYSQQAIHFFPGAIYRFSDFFAGNYRALEQSRNPISVSTDNLANSTGPVFQQVTNPTGENIRTQIANIVRNFSTSTGSASIQYRIFTSENDADLSIKLSAGGGYAGFKASGGFSTQSTEKRYYMTIDAIKPLYTITASYPQNGYFSDKSIETNNPNLIVLKSVTYGTRVLANVEITVNTQKDLVDFKASFGADSGKGVSANFAATFDYLKSSRAANTTANVYVVGGPIGTTLFNTAKMQEEITELISKCNYQTAQPIAYSFTDINGNILGIQSATDQFTTPKCTPLGSVYKIVGASLTIRTGTDNKEQGSNASFAIYNSRGAQTFVSDLNNVEFKNTNDITLNYPSEGSPNEVIEAAFANGGSLDIFFEPKQILFGWDAWNVEGVTLNLVFQDQTGAQKASQLNFSGAKVLLQKNQQRLRLQFNGQFQAGSAQMPGLN
jgi:hypothetical protein